ncbi:outer membrane protein [Candidatus Moduliflexus flocculans]|uniref:Outer membrane protein n=1 Tax=Candidatus Moduliflexus flocculans TaxID=1499966 RepID=A0A0S6VT95_9BACT|nr:outer membrane protein [Candidatus Moduliflexus flocculans]
MRKMSGIVTLLLVLAMVSVAGAETVTYTENQYWLSDTPTKYGPKGLYTIFSPETYQKGKFGVGFYWDMTRFAIPGDPRYPQLTEFTLGGAYGITDRLEVSAALPYTMYKLNAVSTENRDPADLAVSDYDDSGLDDMSLAVRYMFPLGASSAITPFVQTFLPTGSDPDNGLGAENWRIIAGVSAGTQLQGLNKTRLYTQLAYQFATDPDESRRDFSENNSAYPRPRFQNFGKNPFFHEYGNTLLYGAGFAIPVSTDKVEIFGEFTGFHSFDDEDYVPMWEVRDDGTVHELDVVQDGGMMVGGARIGFGNGLVLTAGGGGQLYGEEPLFNNPHWTAFAGLSYMAPHTVTLIREVPPTGEVLPPSTIEQPVAPIKPGAGASFDCTQQLAMVNFEFDKSTLTPEGIATLQRLGKIMRLCDQLVLEVQGHTDWMGTENYNMGLGNRRARAAVYYLVYDEGIDPARIVKPEKLAKGIIAGETYGESVPIATNETDAGRAQNRRAQFVKLVEDNRILTQ